MISVGLICSGPAKALLPGLASTNKNTDVKIDDAYRVIIFSLLDPISYNVAVVLAGH